MTHTQVTNAPSAVGVQEAPVLLNVENVSVSFGGVQALDGVSVSVRQGSIVGLIGPNGAGKTTLFNCVSGLQRVDAGTVSFEGRDITDLPAHRRAALGMGRSFQNLGLILDQTLRVNLMAAQHLSAGYVGMESVIRPWRWWAAERRMNKRAVEAAAAFGSEDRLDKRLADLSFGQSRFAELACVLAESPRLMLLDEPTTGLDIRATGRLRERLVKLRAEGETILLVAHNVRFVMGLCDWVYVLAGGRMLSQGPPEVVRADERVAAVYLGKTIDGV